MVGLIYWLDLLGNVRLDLLIGYTLDNVWFDLLIDYTLDNVWFVLFIVRRVRINRCITDAPS